MGKRTFFSGDTLAQALLDAARYHGVEPEGITYEAVDKRHGFVKRARRVVIRVDPDAPGGKAASREAAGETASAETAAPAVARQLTERPGTLGRRSPRAVAGVVPEAGAVRDSGFLPEPSGLPPGGFPQEGPAARPALTGVSDREEELEHRGAPGAGVAVSEEAVRSALSTLLGLAKLELEAEVRPADAEGLVVELSGADAALVLEDQGRVLEALQHLLPRLLRGEAGEYVPCRIDCRGFRERREEALKQLALRALGEVRRKGRPQILKPLSPADRRVVHMALADVDGVETESEGEGFFKRIVVRLSESGSESDSP